MSRQNVCIRSKLHELSEALIGTPFKHLGRTKEEGFDCYGLFIFLMKEIGVEIPDWTYNQDWAKHGKNYFVENYHFYAQEIRADCIKAGDAALLKGVNGTACHVVVCIGGNKFIHTLKGIGVSIASFDLPMYQRRLVGFYHMKRQA